MTSSRTAPLFAFGLACIALTGCERKIDQKRLDELIQGIFEDQLEVEVESIDCPKDVKIEKDKTFECEVSVKPEGMVPMTVEITDAKGTVSVKTKYQVVDPVKLVKDIAGALKAKKIDAKVDCGKKIRLAEPKSEFSCKATASDGSSKDAKVTVDKDGKISWAM